MISCACQFDLDLKQLSKSIVKVPLRIRIVKLLTRNPRLILKTPTENCSEIYFSDLLSSLITFTKVKCYLLFDQLFLGWDQSLLYCNAVRITDWSLGISIRHWTAKLNFPNRRIRG